MRAAAFLAVGGGPDGAQGLDDKILELQRLDQVGVPDHRAVFHADVGDALEHLVHLGAALVEALLGAEHRAVVLHGPLHGVAELRGAGAARGMAQAVEAGDRGLAGMRHLAMRLARCQHLAGADGGGAAEHDEIEQRIGAEPVGAVDRDAGRLAHRHQTGHDMVGIAVLHRHHFAVNVGRDAAHVVVAGRQDRDGLARDIDAGKDTRGLCDARQALVDDLGIEMLDVQLDVILVGAAAAAFADFDGHRAADNVARSEVLGRRRIALHEALAARVGDVAAFAAHTLGDQTARAVDAGGMELDEFHVLDRQTGAHRHGAAVACAGVRRGGGEIDATVAAGRQHHHVGAEAMDRAVVEVPRHDAAANAAFVHDEVEGEILDEELGVMFQRLLVERVQDGVAGTVGGGAGALSNALAEFGGHTAEWALINFALGGAAEGDAVVLKLDDGGNRLAHHVFDGILVAQPVRPLDGVVHVPAPVVGTHVAERGRDAALRRHCVAAGRKHLGDAGGLQTLLGHAEGGAEAGAAGAHHHDVILMVDDRVGSTADIDRPRRGAVALAAARLRHLSLQTRYAG